jgi:K+-sensing histidine kinase KdpD
MEIRQNVRVASSVVPTFLVLFYVLPFAIVAVFHQNLTGEGFWMGIGREATWWLFFVPALFLPYFYGFRGTRIVGFSSGSMAPVLILLLVTSQQAKTLWFHGLLALTGSFLVGYCVGLLTERLQASKNALDVQNKLLKSLYEASELFAFSLDPADVLDKSLKIIRESLGFDYADIWLLDDEYTLRIAASNLPPIFGAPQTFPANFCLPGLALTSGESVYIQDPLNDDRILDKNWVKQLGNASEAALPLIHQGEKLGVVVVASMKPYIFTPERCELLQTFVNQLALSIKNARLYTEMEQKALMEN